MSVSHRILVVDDEDSVRQSLVANIELEGYEVFAASTGTQAIEAIKRQPVDLVITDICMPGMNGVETFREIRRICPDTTVVLMTAYSIESIIKQGLSEGAYTVIHKPFEMEHVIGIIARALKNSAILVVDDVTDVADSIVQALRAMGLRAEAANDGVTAVQIVRDNDVDLCVLDLVMPDTDGVKTFELLRNVNPSVSVIAMTGYSVPRMIHQVMSDGGYSCMRKPFAIPELAHAIARARGEVKKC